MFPNVLLGHLLRQFRLQLGSNGGEQFRVVREKGHVHVRLAEYEQVFGRHEFHRAFEVLFVDIPERLRPLEFHPLRANPPARAALGDGHDPGKTNVHEHRRLLLFGPAAR